MGALVKLKTTTTKSCTKSAAPRRWAHSVTLQSCTSIIRAIWENWLVKNLRGLDVRETTLRCLKLHLFLSLSDGVRLFEIWRLFYSAQVLILHFPAWYLYIPTTATYREGFFREFRAVFSLYSSYQNNMKNELPLAATCLMETFYCHFPQVLRA